MTKQRAKIEIMVADGDAGLVEQSDLRFDCADWPISFCVPPEDADEWFAQFDFACHERGWSSSGLAQQDSVENSGTVTKRDSRGGKPPVLDLVWQRPREGSLEVKIRLGVALSESSASELLSLVSKRVRTRFRKTYYRSAFLEFGGPPWRGEIWLSDSLRLGPPSQFPDSINGPQAICIDADVPGIGPSGATNEFERQKEELAIFLSVLLGSRICVQRNERLWVWKPGPEGSTLCDVRQRGYWEQRRSTGLPRRGVVPKIPLVELERPDLERFSSLGGQNEVVFPNDIDELWNVFESLSPERHRQFLEAGKTFQLGMRISVEFQSASLALFVVACEALKPHQVASKKKHSRRVGFFNIVETLLGKTHADELRNFGLNPVGLRDEHLHLGKIFGEELDPFAFTSTYRDPTFSKVRDSVKRYANATLIEWLRRGGQLEQRERLK